MNVYKINRYHIAAKDADSAFTYFLDGTSSLDEVFFGSLNEGEEDSFEIKIRRLTAKEMDDDFITCCFDGCELCKGKDEPVLFSPKEMVKKTKEFPCIICREE